MYIRSLFQKRAILALYLDDIYWKAALVTHEGKKRKVAALHTFTKEDVKPLYMLRSLLKGKKVKIVSALSPEHLLIRQTQFHLSNKEAILKVLPFQVEALIPYPPQEAIVAPLFRKVDKKTTSVTLIATKTAHLHEHLTTLQQLEIYPDSLSAAHSSLQAYARLVAPNHPNIVLFYLGEKKSFYLSIQSHQIAFSQTINIGRQSFIKEEEESRDFAAFQNLLQKDFERMAAFIESRTSCRQLLLTGNFPQKMEELLRATLSDRFSFLQAENPSYAIALGMTSEQEGVEFLQGAFKSPLHKKREKQTIFSYLKASLVLSILLFSGGILYTQKRENDLLKCLHPQVVHSSLAESLDALEKEITAQKKPSPLTLNAPLVSDFLAWLSAHPKLKEIEITELDYTLTSFPTLEQEREPYEAKISLRFNAATPRKAREFHELLMRGDKMINCEKPISWEAHDEDYFTSFFLKKG